MPKAYIEKLYIVTHNELTLQYQLPQTVHAVIQFANEFPKEQKKWFHGSNTVVILAAKSLHDLQKFSEELTDLGVKHSKFYEPDIGNQLTAITIVPGPEVKGLCSRFKLAGR